MAGIDRQHNPHGFAPEVQAHHAAAEKGAEKPNPLMSEFLNEADRAKNSLINGITPKLEHNEPKDALTITANAELYKSIHDKPAATPQFDAHIASVINDNPAQRVSSNLDTQKDNPGLNWNNPTPINWNTESQLKFTA